MYRLIKGIDIDFSHHVRGHAGPCINIHGHTWRFEVVLAAHELNADGFVLDFKELKTRVLEPCHRLLDHALAVGESTWNESKDGLAVVGRALVDSRLTRHGTIDTQPRPPMSLHEARLEYPGDMKVAVFPFAPTSERLAKWLFELASAQLSDERVQVRLGRIYETQRPVESIAEYGPA
jgi:6-pyruvoyl-tetrahydropterin synthase